MIRLFLFLLVLGMTFYSCIPPKKWLSRVPASFVTLSSDAIKKDSGSSGHLARYADIRKLGNKLKIESWDLIRIKVPHGRKFPLPVHGESKIYAFSRENNSIKEILKTTITSFHGERVCWISRNELYPEGYLILNRSYWRSFSGTGLFKTVGRVGTIRALFRVSGFKDCPGILTPPEYKRTIKKKDLSYEIRFFKKKNRESRYDGYLFLKGLGKLYSRLNRLYFPKQFSSARGGTSKKVEKKQLLKMKLHFQRVCREGEYFTPAFFPQESGQAILAQRLIQGARELGFKAELILPSSFQGKKRIPLPRPGVLVSGKRYRLWLFPENRTQAAGKIPNELQGMSCVLLNGSTLRMAVIPRQPHWKDRVSLWSKISCNRSGSGSIYFTYRMQGDAASLGRKLSGLSPVMSTGKSALSRIFLPGECVSLNWIRIKHRLPTHQPFQGKARGRISGVIHRTRGTSVAGFSLIRRKYGSLKGAWNNREAVYPLFSRLWAFHETIVLILPRGVTPYRLPRRIRIKSGNLVYRASWQYRPGRRYGKPRRWSWRRWARWKRSHYRRRRGKLILRRRFTLSRSPVSIRAKKILRRQLGKIDYWDEKRVGLRWR